MIRAKLLQSHSYHCSDVLFREDRDPLICLDDGVYEITDSALRQLYHLPAGSVPVDDMSIVSKSSTALAYSCHQIYLAYRAWSQCPDETDQVDSTVVCLSETGAVLWEQKFPGQSIAAIAVTETGTLFVVCKNKPDFYEDLHQFHMLYELGHNRQVICQKETPFLCKFKPYRNSALFLSISNDRVQFVQMMEDGTESVLTEIALDPNFNIDTNYTRSHYDTFIGTDGTVDLLIKCDKTYRILRFSSDQTHRLHLADKMELPEIPDVENATISAATLDQRSDSVYSMEHYIPYQDLSNIPDIPTDSVESSIQAFMQYFHMVTRVRRVHCPSMTEEIIATYPDHYGIQGPKPMIVDSGICITIWDVRGKVEVWFQYPDGKKEMRKVGDIRLAWSWHNTVILVEHKVCGYLFRIYNL